MLIDFIFYANFDQMTANMQYGKNDWSSMSRISSRECQDELANPHWWKIGNYWELPIFKNTSLGASFLLIFSQTFD